MKLLSTFTYKLLWCGTYGRIFEVAHFVSDHDCRQYGDKSIRTSLCEVMIGEHALNAGIRRVAARRIRAITFLVGHSEGVKACLLIKRGYLQGSSHTIHYWLACIRKERLNFALGST